MSKKPKSIIFLIIISAWAILMNIGSLLRYQTVSDYQVLQNNSAEYLFFVFGILLLILNILTLWFLLKPKRIGFTVAISTLIVSATSNAINFYFMFQDLDFAKKVYILSREARGMKIDERALEFFFTPPTAYLMAVFGFIWILVLFLLFFKNKNYFLDIKKTVNN